MMDGLCLWNNQTNRIPHSNDIEDRQATTNENVCFDVAQPFMHCSCSSKLGQVLMGVLRKLFLEKDDFTGLSHHR